MPTRDATPFADWPPELTHLWNKFALRGDLDSCNPPATTQGAYNQVLPLHLQAMHETAEAICTDLRLLEADLLASQGPPPAATCARCGAGSLTRYVTARKTGATYCTECAERFAKRAHPGP